MKYYCFLLLMVFAASCKQSHAPLSPRLNHVMLHVTDLDASVRFYQDAFDLELERKITELEITSEDGSSQTVEVNMALLRFPGQDFVFEISQQNLGDKATFPRYQHVGIDVGDIEAAMKQAQEFGAIPVSGIRTVSAGDIAAKNAFLQGPDGELVELMQVLKGRF